MKSVLIFVTLASPRNDRGFKKAEMHAKFQFEGLCAGISVRCEESWKVWRIVVFLQNIAAFQRCSNLLRLILPSLVNSGVQIQ